MKYILYLTCAAALADDLCATWNPTQLGSKCSTAQSCCAQNAAFPPNCTAPLSCPSSGTPPNCSSSFVTQDDYAFAGNGEYALTGLVATGNCPSLGIMDSTVQSGVITYGTYTTMGPNNVSGNWTKLVYQPSGAFQATLVKTGNGHTSFFTAGYTIGGGVMGPCTDLLVLFNDPDYGCPCNGTWTSGGFNSNGTSPATRNINKTQCTLANGTSSCPEDFFFSVSARYGSYRVVNITNNTMRQLDITRPVFDQAAGWSDNNVFASFTANFSCPASVVPTPPPKSGAVILSSSAVVLVMCMLVL